MSDSMTIGGQVVDRLPDSFFEEFPSAETRLAAEIIERWARLNGLGFRLGSHATTIPSWYVFDESPAGSYDLVRLQPETDRGIKRVGAPGIVSIDFRRAHAGFFADHANRRELLRRLQEVTGDSFNDSKVESWVSVKWSALVQPGVITRFLGSLDWALKGIRDRSFVN